MHLIHACMQDHFSYNLSDRCFDKVLKNLMLKNWCRIDVKKLTVPAGLLLQCRRSEYSVLPIAVSMVRYVESIQWKWYLYPQFLVIVWTEYRNEMLWWWQTSSMYHVSIVIWSEVKKINVKGTHDMFEFVVTLEWCHREWNDSWSKG